MFFFPVTLLFNEVSACFWRSMPMYYETQALTGTESPPNKCPKNSGQFCFGFSCRKNPNRKILNFTTGILGSPWPIPKSERITMSHEVWPPIIHLHRWELLLKLMTDWRPTKCEEIQAKLMFFSGLKVEHIKKKHQISGAFRLRVSWDDEPRIGYLLKEG